MAINHGVLSEKGNGKNRAKSIPKLIRELLMEVVPRGALIDDSFLAGLKTRRRRITQASAFIFLSSGRARLFAFEESNTRLGLQRGCWRRESPSCSLRAPAVSIFITAMYWLTRKKQQENAKTKAGFQQFWVYVCSPTPHLV